MTDPNTPWGAAGIGLGIAAMAGMYGMMTKPEPTVEELKSELEAMKKSHEHCNRALTNMSVALSDTMDRCVAHEELKRKTQLEHDGLVDELSEKIKKLEGQLLAADKRTDAAELELAKKNAAHGGSY